MLLTSEDVFMNRLGSVESEPANWFCIRTHPKHEHLAAARLQKMEEVEVFLPRIRFKRATRQAVVQVTEALFPGYLFARFDWDESLRQVQSAPNVRDIVHFGDHWPVVPGSLIDELRRMVGTAGMVTITPEFFPGDAVHLADGKLRGLRGVVSRVLPGQKRVEVLMELLGRTTRIETTICALLKEGDERAGLLPR